LWTITSSRQWYVNNTLVTDTTDYGAALTKFTINGQYDGTVPTPGLIDDVYFWDGYLLTSNDVATLVAHGDPSTRSQ
jgi:hypothetical protein